MWADGSLAGGDEEDGRSEQTQLPERSYIAEMAV